MFFLLTWILYVLGVYAGLVLSLGLVSALGQPTASFLFRCLAAYGTMVCCAIYGTFASIFLTLVGLRGISQWATARAFKHTMWWTTGVGFEVVGDGPAILNGTRPAVFVGNHQSELDVLMLGTVFPHWCSVTAKKQLRHMPFLGWFMALSGTVFIDRANAQSARSAFTGAANEMRSRRQSVFIFPEGTRSYAEEPTLLPFKKGAFHLAVQAGVPIVPVVASCYSGVLNTHRWRFRQGKIPVAVLPPIPTTGLTAADVDGLCQDVRERMLQALIEITKSPAGQSAFLADPTKDTTAARNGHIGNGAAKSFENGELRKRSKLADAAS